MKFVIAAVVVLALAMGVQSSIIAGLPGLLGPLGHTTVVAGPGQVLAQGPAVLGWGAHGLGLPAAVNIAASPLIAAGHGAAIAAAIPAIPAHGASYIAKTRGAFVIAAVVVLALAMGVQSSIIAGLPGLLGPLGHTTVVAGPGQVLAQGPAVLGWGAHGLGLPAAVNIAASPLIAAGHGAAIAAAIPAIPAHGASYIAKTRGAVHTAPLPGHIQSAASVNLAPAPGTW